MRNREGMTTRFSVDADGQQDTEQRECDPCVVESRPMTKWLPPPPNLTLNNNDVHVWLAELDVPPNEMKQLGVFLSSDEQQRAARLRFEHDRLRFIVGRGLLRHILGHYLQLHPASLRFQYSYYRKPSLLGYHEIRFNVSHARSQALFAITCEREIGVDIEYIKSDFDVEALAAHFFSTEEIRMLSTVPVHKRRAAFFACWTRKEAYIKAKGEGLSLPLHEFDVSLIPGKPAQLLATRPDAQEASRWKLIALDAPNGYKAALVTEGKDWQLSCWKVPDNLCYRED